MTSETLPLGAPLKMADIARMSGVSVSTVSRALAGSPLIPKTLRDKITAIADEHGYVVNQAARNLRLKTTRTIGLVLPVDDNKKLKDPNLAKLMGALAEAVFRRGYELLLLKNHTRRTSGLKDLVQSQRFDGMLVVPDTSADAQQHEALNELARYYMPLVVWGRLPDQSLYCGVDFGAKAETPDANTDDATPINEGAEAMVDLLFRRLNGEATPSLILDAPTSTRSEA